MSSNAPRKIVIESPLSAPTSVGFRHNFRFLLWCCRAVWLKDGAHAIASHLLNPWFMDDTNPDERAAGIANPWVWGSAPHYFFTDLGMTGGMEKAFARCVLDKISHARTSLAEYAPECWAAFERGEWPPHTPGFEIARQA